MRLCVCVCVCVCVCEYMCVREYVCVCVPYVCECTMFVCTMCVYHVCVCMCVCVYHVWPLPHSILLRLGLVRHGVEHGVLHEDADRPTHEGREEVDVDVVPRAVEASTHGPEKEERNEGNQQGRERNIRRWRWMPSTHGPKKEERK